MHVMLIVWIRMNRCTFKRSWVKPQRNGYHRYARYFTENQEASSCQTEEQNLSPHVTFNCASWKVGFLKKRPKGKVNTKQGHMLLLTAILCSSFTSDINHGKSKPGSDMYDSFFVRAQSGLCTFWDHVHFLFYYFFLGILIGCAFSTINQIELSPGTKLLEWKGLFYFHFHKKVGWKVPFYCS